MNQLVNENKVLSPKATKLRTQSQLYGTKNENRKLWLKKNGFSLFMKVCTDSAEVTSSGRQLQTHEAATGNALLPKVDSRVDVLLL